MNTRNLAIEAVGDGWRGEIKPRIRISGQWLERAGFPPGHRVEVTLEQPGTLTLRFLGQSSALREDDSQMEKPRSERCTALGRAFWECLEP